MEEQWSWLMKRELGQQPITHHGALWMEWNFIQWSRQFSFISSINQLLRKSNNSLLVKSKAMKWNLIEPIKKSWSAAAITKSNEWSQTTHQPSNKIVLFDWVDWVWFGGMNSWLASNWICLWVVCPALFDEEWVIGGAMPGEQTTPTICEWNQLHEWKDEMEWN